MKTRRIDKITLALIVCVGVILLLSCALAGHVAVFNDRYCVIALDKNATQQTITGWGTSACWWAQMVEDDTTRDALARYLYSKDGLGLNIYRYNVGGGTSDIERIGNPWRRTESFLVEKDGEWVYDFTRDKNAQDMLFKSLEYGCIDTVVLFANSPHYSMTISGMASGHTKSPHNNLAPDKIDEFVKYMLDITEYFLSRGVPVKYVSPINEPENGWGGEWVGQEGCYYDIDMIVATFKAFALEIKARDLDVKLSGAEACGAWDNAREYYIALSQDKDVMDCLASYAFHSYGGDEIDNGYKYKRDFGAWCAKNIDENVSLDMSEWCELPCLSDINSMDGALIMARVIARDISLVGVNSWTSWVAVNDLAQANSQTFSDGMIAATTDFSEYYIAKRYYAMAHFAKYVPVGSKVINARYNFEGRRDISFSTFVTPDGKIVLVLVNEGDDISLKLNADTTQMTIVQTSDNHNLKEIYSGDFIKDITVPSQSIVTIVLN